MEDIEVIVRQTLDDPQFHQERLLMKTYLNGSIPRLAANAATTGQNPFARATACKVIHSAIVCTLGAASLTLGSASAVAQNLSDQPIRIVTPYAPGFGFDVTLSRITPELSKLLGQTVRVEHHPVAPGQAALGQIAVPLAVPAAVSDAAPAARTFVFTLWAAAKQTSQAPGVRVSYEPVSSFVPILTIRSAVDGGTVAAPVQYAGFIAAPGTAPALIAHLRQATLRVMDRSTLKVWSEVNGAHVALIDGPGFSQFLVVSASQM